MKRTKTFPLVLTASEVVFSVTVLGIIICLILTSCEKKGAAEEKVTDNQAAVSAENVQAAFSPQNATTAELSSLLEVNGVKITFPCTVKELMDALGKQCSYRLGNIYGGNRENIEDYLFYDYSIPLTIMHNKEILFDIYIHEKDYTGDIETSLVYPVSYHLLDGTAVGFNYDSMERAKTEIRIADKITYNCTADDVQQIFGKQEINEYTKESLIYDFSTDGYKCELIFGFDDFLYPGYRADKKYEPKLIFIGYYFTKESDIINDAYKRAQERLPEGYTMDELLNGFQINGKTVPIPFTIEGLMSADSKISYKIAKGYKGMEDYCGSADDPEIILQNYDKVGYDILYDGEEMINFLNIHKDDFYRYGAEKSPLNYLGYGLASMYLNDKDIDVRYLGKIGFDSDYNDIVSCLGKPICDSDYMIYIFTSGGRELKLEFSFKSAEFEKGEYELINISYSYNSGEDSDE